MSNVIYCKNDGKPMYFIEESEKLSNGEYRATFSYKCMVCGYRVMAEQAFITRDQSGNIIVKRRILSQ